jgi:hypothetical protein
MYYIIGIVEFPMRLTHRTTKAIDNIFLYISRVEYYSVIPLSNGLSHHDTQILIKKQVALIMLIIALQFDVSTSFNM